MNRMNAQNISILYYHGSITSHWKLMKHMYVHYTNNTESTHIWCYIFFFAWGGENAITHAQWPASLGYVGVGRMSLPYPLKTPPPSSSALRTDNPGKTCRQSSGLSFRAPLYLLLRAVTAHVFLSASSEYWAGLLLRFAVVSWSCPHCSA